ncbi:paired amphipathic helix protein Sin3a [Vigna unguiculata]|uniref:Paired amphipathic helix protein Sin3a n=1 Tax=Vigna unguiculata TaxID=3917 RepID=A0A4D6L2H8_VIGUN|nr:paired amphipathic helix protein Sin3a [Vigna unguiculata]
MDVGTVVEKVEEILKDHDDLISGFNKFLPKGYEILLPPKDTVQLKDAIKYVQKIKDRFQNTDRIYKRFVRILTNRDKNDMSASEIFHKASVVEKLFEGHHDLVRDFTLFLPDA